MKNRNKLLLASSIAAVLMAGTGIAQASPTYWVDSAGSPVSTGTGGCWSAMNGSAMFCSDKDGDGVDDAMDACPDTPAGTKVDAKGCALDSDGDGVSDAMDACPGTAQGVKVDAKGCGLDSDGDGVTDSLDQCPGTAMGVKVDAKGCALDSDGDGVVNGMDNCPGTPAGTKVDANGCMMRAVLNDLTFALDKADLDASARDSLDTLANQIASNPNITKVKVTGYTDSTGAESYNKDLSMRRAETVKAYFVSKGVAADKIVTSGEGSANPVADNATAAGRMANRRVEVDFEM